MISSKYEIGDTVNIEITTKNFGRIAAQRAIRRSTRTREQLYTITSI